MIYLALAALAVGLILWLIVTSRRNQPARNRTQMVSLGSEELRRLAASLSMHAAVRKKKRRDGQASSSLHADMQQVRQAHGAIAGQDQSEEASPAEQWLLDNYYYLEQQAHVLAQELRSRRREALPVLADGSIRIAWLAQELLAHTAGKLDQPTILEFIEEFQRKTPLMLCELWALPLYLKLALLSCVAEVSESCQRTRLLWERADRLAEQAGAMTTAAWENCLLEEQALLPDQVEGALVERLNRRLMEEGERSRTALQALDEAVLRRGFALSDLIFAEHHRQAREQWMMGNAISSLRFLDGLQWLKMFRKLSLVERNLLSDPTGVYPTMDAQSQSWYHSRLEKLAAQWDVSESYLSHCALELARQQAHDARKGHMGYYFLDEGRGELARAVDRKPRRELSQGSRLALYLTAQWAPALLISGGLFALVFYTGAGWPLAVGLSALLLLPVHRAVQGVVDGLLANHLAPRHIPRLDMSRGIPQQGKTVVAVTALLSSPKRALQLLDDLEAMSLANPWPQVAFLLLGDYPECREETDEGDAAIAEAVQNRLHALQSQYGQERFHVLLRRRVWSKTQRCFMGYERKRGALLELNQLLLYNELGTFEDIEACPVGLAGAQYVCTLDADTGLPPGVLPKLIGAMLHPLNTPVVEGGRVVRGHALLQPRVGMSVEAARQSKFSRIFAGKGGLDAYSGAVSNVYQDVFGRGIFTGKGIYHVRTFDEVLGCRLPDNCVLSHDLLEGSFLRCGLVSDLTVIDGFPANLYAYLKRQHRWVRGDWQLLPWMGKTMPGARMGRQANPLPALCRWQMVDNLLRALTPVMTLAAMLLAAALGGEAWMLLAWAPLVAPWAIESLLHIARAGDRLPGVRQNAAEAGARVGLQLLFLPIEALSNLDAILRTLARLATRRNLLQWVTAADTERGTPHGARGLMRYMAPQIWTALALIAIGVLRFPRCWTAFALASLWIAALPIAFTLGLRRVPEPYQLAQTDRIQLRMLARRTWQYFAKFVTEENHYLPPDNVQIHPYRGEALRTSPTNMGLALVAQIAAWRLGYQSQEASVQAIGRMTEELERLEKWRGHWYNWYDIRTQEVLRPHYVSTVDSGNLAACLLLTAQALEESRERPLDRARLAQGAADVLRIAAQACQMDVHERIYAALDQATDEEEARAALAAASQQVQALSGHWAKLAEEDIAQAQRTLSAPTRPLDTQPLVKRLRDMAAGMDFSILYDESRGLFRIGMDVQEGKPSESYYDMLASESRLTSLVAMALGQVPYDHWAKLGRTVAEAGGGQPLMSWGGTMFEYLMPALFLPHEPGTLLGETLTHVLQAQQDYAANLGIPWGISESGYYDFDLELHYQYRSFGVPGVGMRAGLDKDRVISPYSTVMALPFAPQAALRNLAWLRELGLEGDYGMVEAVDFTPERHSGGETHRKVASYMVHHEGMSLMALTNLLADNALADTFSHMPLMRAVSLLWQERPADPGSAVTHLKPKAALAGHREHSALRLVHEYEGRDGLQPVQVHLLSNGHYHVGLTQTGAGASRWQDISINRWRDDALTQEHGVWVAVRRETDTAVLPTTYRLDMTPPEAYKATFEPHRAVFDRQDGDLHMQTRVMVCPEQDAEIRRITLENRSAQEIHLEVTLFFELALCAQADDLAHMAFRNLFIHTALQDGVLWARRRPRTPGEAVPHLACRTIGADGPIAQLEVETDRSLCLGRGRKWQNARMFQGKRPLKQSLGYVLDPAICLRTRVTVPAQRSVQLAFVLACAQEEAAVRSALEALDSLAALDRAEELAWAYAQAQARYLGLTPPRMQLFQQMQPLLVYDVKTPSGAASSREQLLGRLWPLGISGSLPIVTLCLASLDQVHVAGHLMAAHALWRARGLSTDLVLIAEEGGDYLRPLQEKLQDLVLTSGERELYQARGGIFVLPASQLDEGVRGALQEASRLYLHADAPLTGQVQAQIPPALPAMGDLHPIQQTPVPLAELPTTFHNGWGGFSPDGREYILTLDADETTPAPWSMLLVNPQFGTLLTERGGGYTWQGNCHSHRLTPWSNDPLRDPPGDCLYIQDALDGGLWSPTPAPLAGQGPRRIRYSPGFVVYECGVGGLEQTLTVFVPWDRNVKVQILRLHNPAGHTRQLRLTGYAHWVLGERLDNALTALETGFDSQSQAVWARRPGDGVAYLAFAGRSSTYTTSRGRFLGLGGDLSRPHALCGKTLPGPGQEGGACAALETDLTLRPGETAEVTLLMGWCDQRADLDAEVAAFATPQQGWDSLQRTLSQWQGLLGGIQVQLPDPALQYMVNTWLLYQVYAARFFGRTGFYQSGGAFGFRDQLQDCLAMLYQDAGRVRGYLLEAAAHQFQSGDVQHWWHKPARGVRTHMTDDLLFLPLVTHEYVSKTGDAAILSEQAPYLQDVDIPEGQEDFYGDGVPTDTTESLLQHCLKAVDRVWQRRGEHGLPLIGTGDWNDAMNSLGDCGRGESVWLGFFLIYVLHATADLCRQGGQKALASALEDKARIMTEAVEASGWDGAWYRRAYDDEGRPVGASQSDECRIDCISQAWSAISGAGSKERVEQALDAADSMLVDRREGLVKLLTPPFDVGEQEPGYIKGYVPGVRENGGQYTHGALWLVWAYVHMGWGRKATELMQMINPVSHAATPMEAARYRVEPYVVAADVYSQPPHAGRGGWTWYTGSASWMYRIVVEELLGLKVQGKTLALAPCVDPRWKGYDLTYRYGSTYYHIHVDNPKGAESGIAQLLLDSEELPGSTWELRDDGQEHFVYAVMGRGIEKTE